MVATHCGTHAVQYFSSYMTTCSQIKCISNAVLELVLILLTQLWVCHRLVTLAELAKMLGGRGDQSKLDPDRQPICLLLGGGMAAGKSTVRKIIGQAEFWTRVWYLDMMAFPLHQVACSLVGQAAKVTQAVCWKDVFCVTSAVQLFTDRLVHCSLLVFTSNACLV